jgi:hypothetical protein
MKSIKISMKTIFQSFIVFSLAFLAISCKDKIKDTYLINEPIYMSYDDLRTAVKTKSAQEIIQPGKLYFKGHYIFVNEYMSGIHVVDNEDPSKPQILRFIEIPGNVDLAIKENILYADSYIDLVAIDISNLENIREVARIENAFPYMIPEYEDGIVEQVDETRGVITGWRRIEKTVEVDPEDYSYGKYRGWAEDMMYVNVDYSAPAEGGSEFGTGGSMARFTLYDNYMYAVDISTLRLFNTSEPDAPVLEKEFNIGWNIETIFPYDQKLFIGTQTGMLIYSLADPSNPNYISEFTHTSNCDPVVVEGDYAYVTLRAGNLCGDNESQLDVIDISDIYSPYLLKEYPMSEPYGLGIDDSILFVCDGRAGLKIYNASDPMTIANNKLAEYPEINAFDVIPLGDILLLIGTDGLSQYDYSDPVNITQLSFIPIYAHD